MVVLVVSVLALEKAGWPYTGGARMAVKSRDETQPVQDAQCVNNLAC
jgi:hypothetical protein